MASLTQRMFRAAKLDVSLYEEVEADPKAMGQAMTVVALASVAAGLGTISQTGMIGLIWGTIGAFAGWYIWAFITYIIGTKLLPEPQTHADHGELLRTLGFAASPGLIRVAGVIPLLGPLVMLASAIWMLVATVIAVRQALDYRSTGRAGGVCIIGWIVQLVIFAILGRLLAIY